MLRRVIGNTTATDLATARNNLRTVSQGGRPAAGAARRTASPRGPQSRGTPPRGVHGSGMSSQSGDD